MAGCGLAARPAGGLPTAGGVPAAGRVPGGTATAADDEGQRARGSACRGHDPDSMTTETKRRRNRPHGARLASAGQASAPPNERPMTGAGAAASRFETYLPKEPRNGAHRASAHDRLLEPVREHGDAGGRG